MTHLELDGVTKVFGDPEADGVVAVDDLSLDVADGDFLVLLGPSGCGKSTTLHIIAGLLEPTEGTVSLRGTDVTDTRPEERNIGLVFQHSTLFPHMTVEENLRYGLRMQDVDPAVHDERIEKYLELVHMTEHRDYNPGDLSGGQQRRISLARSLIYEPDILLLDEPLTGLDRVLREEMRNEIRTILQDVGVTTLYVTHDQAEALSMSDRVIVMDEGRIEQVADPVQLYEQPESEFVANFVGKSTSFEGQVVSNSTVVDDGERNIHLTDDTDVEAGESVSAYLRPEDIEVDEVLRGTDAPNAFVGHVRNVQYLGHRSELEVELEDGTRVTVYTEAATELQPDSEVVISFEPEDIIVL